MNLNLSSFRSISPNTKWLLLLTVGIIIVIIAISLYSSKTNVQQTIDFAIVIGISSAHTRVTPFKWSDDKVKNTALVETENSCIVHSGVNEHTKEINTLYSSFLVCLQASVKIIPTDTEKNVQIYAVFTDGFSLLKQRNNTLASEIKEQLFHQLVNFQSDKLKFTVSYPTTMTGREEGLFSWVQLNYLLKFIPPKNSNPETVGVLRLGDTASQMAFSTKPSSANDAIELFGTQWMLRVDSNQCFGADEIAKRYFLFIIKTISQQMHTTNVPDPCSNKNMVRYINGSDLIDNECIQTIDVPIQKYINATALYKFTGNGNMETCKMILQSVLNANECSKSFRYCFRNDTSIWRKDTDFYATGYYYNATRVLPTLNEHASTNYPNFALEATAFCLLDWNSVLTTNPNISPNTCLLLNFIEQSLSTIYNIQSHEWIDIKFVDKVDNNELDWSLGYMLFESNNYPNMPSAVRKLGIAAFLFFLILASFLVAYSSMKLCGSKLLGQTNAKQPAGEYEII